MMKRTWLRVYLRLGNHVALLDIDLVDDMGYTGRQPETCNAGNNNEKLFHLLDAACPCIRSAASYPK